jgi:hypothetical protein
MTFHVDDFLMDISNGLLRSSFVNSVASNPIYLSLCMTIVILCIIWLFTWLSLGKLLKMGIWIFVVITILVFLQNKILLNKGVIGGDTKFNNELLSSDLLQHNPDYISIPTNNLAINNASSYSAPAHNTAHNIPLNNISSHNISSNKVEGGYDKYNKLENPVMSYNNGYNSGYNNGYNNDSLNLPHKDPYRYDGGDMRRESGGDMRRESRGDVRGDVRGDEGHSKMQSYDDYKRRNHHRHDEESLDNVPLAPRYNDSRSSRKHHRDDIYGSDTEY